MIQYGILIISIPIAVFPETNYILESKLNEIYLTIFIYKYVAFAFNTATGQ